MMGQLTPQHKVRSTSKTMSFLERECMTKRWVEIQVQYTLGAGGGKA
ncbi:MAG: hypothetical protein LBK01_05120 [Burkholderiaceae bacterium]|nr:hypothetical protein [Burkholderiaceae bacterium]